MLKAKFEVWNSDRPILAHSVGVRFWYENNYYGDQFAGFVGWDKHIPKGISWSLIKYHHKFEKFELFFFKFKIVYHSERIPR